MTFRVSLIEAPTWARRPRVDLEGVSETELAAIQLHRAALIASVQSAVEQWLRDVDENALFPNRAKLTGSFYVGDELYERGEEGNIRISIFCRCLERPKLGTDREDDYLGLEVWLNYVEGSATFEVSDIDSSSI